MKKILYISDCYQQSNNFLQDLAKDLHEKGVAFKVNMRQHFLESNGYKVVCVSVNSFMLGFNHDNAEYLLNCAILTDERSHERINWIKRSAKVIESRDQLCSMLMGG